MAESILQAALARASEGMEIAAVAARAPDRPAVYSDVGNLSFGELNAQVNQIANRLLEAGLQPGDAIALACGNRPEFVVVRFAAHRLGLRLTTVNWHLAADEVAYIVDNCDALALFMDIRLGDAAHRAKTASSQLRLLVAIGGELDGYEDWLSCLWGRSSADIERPRLGTTMLYTSGTTGRPKGVLRKQPDPAKAATMQALLTAVFQFEPESGTDLVLATGPLYHSGPFNLCMTAPLTAGVGCVLMDKWSPEETLALITRYRITHTYFVPTMMNRLLDLDSDVRDAADVSTLRFVIHGGAPCPIDVKQRMMDWLGPIIWEIFAGTEGHGTIVSPQDWLSKPGTVGKPGEGQIQILDDKLSPVEANVVGTLYLANPAESSFSYYKDEEKTANAQKDGYFTAGDMGYLDQDGFLFLTGRSAEVIVSGGVNIYPQEIDNVLIQHSAVADVACVGVPDSDLGEVVKAVVVVKEGLAASGTLEAELLALCEGKIAKQKWPRSFDFREALPRSKAGKVQRKALRDSYWESASRQI
ncbi:MAG: AMP-binding protein [Pseudomonadota bacterium]